MKNYLYSGEQASLAIGTTAGRLMLPAGVTVPVIQALHEAATQNPIAQALIKTGEITVTDAAKPKAKTKADGEGKQQDKVAPDDPPNDPELNPGDVDPPEGGKKLTIPQLKKQLEEAGIEYAADAKREDLEALLPPQTRQS